MELKKTTFFLLICFFVCFYKSKGQSISRFTLSPAGAYTTNTSGSIFSNLGDLQVQTFSVPTGTITQGFVQPYTSVITSIDEVNKNESICLFPNPVRETLTLQYNGESSFFVYVTDLQGRTVMSTHIQPNYPRSNNLINLASLYSGIYFINIIDIETNRLFKSVRIIKL
jgi:hypothetical protein